MRRSISPLRRFARLTLAVPILASTALVLSIPQITHADAPQPNVAVYQIDPAVGHDDWLHSGTQAISLHAPGTISPAFTVPAGRYVTPNGHFAMAMSALGAYQVFDLRSGLQVSGWADSAGKSNPTSMAVSPNGTYAAVSSVSTVNQNDWSVTLFNLTSNTRYYFNGTASTAPAPAGSAPTLQLQPAIVGWTGDESTLILATGVPFTDASTHLFFKMAMSGIAFTPNGTAGTPIPPITALGADQPITQLIFAPNSTRAAFLYDDPGNAPVNFTPITDGPGPLPPNGLKVIDLTTGVVTPIASAAPGQGLTAPAWLPDGSKLYFGSGPYQSTPYPVNVHLFNFDFTSHAITAGDALIASDPAHVGVGEMQICVDQVFMSEISISPATAGPGTASVVSKITSAPLSALGTHTDVYTTAANGLGPCVPAVTGGSTGGGVVPSVPTLGGGATVIVVTATPAPGTATPSGPIACILAPQLTIGGYGIVTAGAANNLRSTPTINSTLVGQIPAGQTFSVLGGPFCDTTSGYVYWQVNYNGTTAYTAEGKTTYLVLPYTPSAPTVTPVPSTATLTAIPAGPTATPTFHLIIIPSLVLLLPPPVQVAPANGAVFNNYPRTTTLVWQPVTGAAHYTVQIQYCPPANTNVCASGEVDYPLVTGLTSISYTFNFIGAQPGRWRVTAISAANISGLPSGWWTFKYTQ